MSSISSSSSYTTTSSNGGIAGLMSGMDTESMVEKLLSGTQTKIDKQNQEKQQTIWKQLMYREVISDINTFKNSFLSSSATTNLASSDFYNAMSATTSSKAFTATATSNAMSGSTRVSVAQLATASKLQSGSAVSGTLTGMIDENALDRTLVLQVAGKGKISVDLGAVLNDASLKGLDNSEKLAKFAELLNNNADLQAAGVSVSVDDKDQLVLEGEGVTISAESSDVALSIMGIKAGQESSDGKITSKADLEATVNFSMTLNGITKTIELDLANITKGNNQSLEDELKSKIDSAFGSGWVNVDVTNGKFTLTANGKGNVVSIEGDKSGLALLGVEAGQSNKISLGQQIKDINFATELQGSNYSFTINGVDFSFDKNTKLSEIINTVNSSKAGVRITYSEIEDKFTMESADTGSGHKIEMEQKEGNLLNAMFGTGANGALASGNTITSDALVAGSVEATSTKLTADEVNYGYFKFNLDGQDYSIYVTKKSDGSKYTESELAKAVNEKLAAKLGYTSDGKQVAELVEKDGKYTFEVRNGAKVTFADNSETAEKWGEMGTKEKNSVIASSLQSLFGFGTEGKQDNAVASGEVKMADVGFAVGSKLNVNGQDVEITSDMTIDQFVQNLNTVLGSDGTATFDEKTGKISIEKADGGNVSVQGGDTAGKLFGKAFEGNDTVALGGVQGAASTFTEGQNAIVSINGVVLERSSNSFTVDGMAYSLTGTNAQAAKLEAATDNNGNRVWKDLADGNVYTVDTNNKIISGVDKNGTALGSDVLAAFDGLTVDANGYLLDAEGSKIVTGEEDTVTTSRNTDQVMEGLKSFVEKYNELITKLNDKITEEDSYREYAPLTDAQKKEMSEKEIELWEEKAKEGLLRRDENISSFLSRMRSILYTKPEGSEYALYQLGIETSSDWKDNGKLVINESKLRSMLEKDPQAIQNLFAGAGGLAESMSKICDSTAGTSSGSQGSLVSLAGVEGKASSISNTLTKRLISINEKIDSLKKKYEKEKERYWKQFSSMETALANLNSQSSWLASYFTY
ncbi:MAG: flagellar filament capping protein FliD [Oscillospiraceae bacterium]|nr:flagellar filament capping protein FliD [Oscillospiraceae bacterium]